MVRVFQGYHPFTSTGWNAHLQHHQFMMSEKSNGVNKLHALKNVSHQLPLACRSSKADHIPGSLYGEGTHAFSVILLELAFIVIATRVVGFLLTPLKQPRLVSQIIGGLFIGPSILGRDSKFKELVLPDDAVYVVKNIGTMGFMYFLFLSGVKMDVTAIRNTGRKYVYITLIGVIVPFLTAIAVGYIFQESMDKELIKPYNIIFISSIFSITNYGVLHPILRELNLLSSEIGRIGLSLSMLGDITGVPIILAFEAANQEDHQPKAAIWYLISLIVLGTFTFTCVKWSMEWIVERTPQGKPVDQNYVVGILLGVLVLGFLTDMFGIAIMHGALWLGLVIPDGPPLGSALVERSETVVTEILMPLSFGMVGLYTDVFDMCSYWSKVWPLFAMSLLAYITKFISTFVASLLYQVPLRDSLTLSLILSLRGQVELMIYIHWMDKELIDNRSFTMLVLITIITTGIASPLIELLNDPTRPYMISTRRTVQHTPSDADINVVLCIYDKESMMSLLNLLEVPLTHTSSPFCVYALQLVELIGRASPMFIDHQQEEESSSYPGYESLYGALKLFQETRGLSFGINAFTVVAPMRTIYQDICEFALLKRSTLIIAPFHKDCLRNLREVNFVRHGVQSVNCHVFSQAPCSVGIFVDKGNFGSRDIVGHVSNSSERHIIMLFLGGADAREALVFADKMTSNPQVHLHVVRFLVQDFEGDDELERKVDDGIVASFYVKHERNQKVSYRELVVRNGEETAAAIKAMNDYDCVLWIIGRKQGINPVLLEGLSAWSENRELGVIGDYVSSYDFGSTASVLVIQQQILKGQRKVSRLDKLYSCTLCKH